MYFLEKTFLFEASHRLQAGYTGKCTNNHGHSWVCKIILRGEELDGKAMLMDFSDMKAIKNWIDDNLDHATILLKGDPFLEYLKNNGHKTWVTEENPTSEHICFLLFEKARELFENERVRVYAVSINETCTSRAEYRG